MRVAGIVTVLLLSFTTIFTGTLFAKTEMYAEYQDLKNLQMELNRRPLDQQEQLRPTISQAERRACQKLRQEQRDGVRLENYHREGGDELLAFVLQFDRYCQTLQ